MRLSQHLFLISLALLCACKKPPEVSTTPVRRGDVESVVTSVNAGTVRAEDAAELAFGAVGRVKSVNAKLGDTVRKGAILAEVENDDMRTGLARAQREFDRRAQLKSHGVSESERDTTKQAIDSALMALEKTLIRAPYDGIITEVNIEVGQLSQITAVIPKAPLRIVDLGPRYVRAEIDEVDLPKVKVGQPARVKILAVSKEPFKATVRRVVPYISNVREQDRTAEVELDLEVRDPLPAGASADVEIITDRHQNVPAVGSRGVLGRKDDRYVYLFKDGHALKQPITIGLSNFDLTEILSGLNEGDIVIIPTDLAELKEGTEVRVR